MTRRHELHERNPQQARVILEVIMGIGALLGVLILVMIFHKPEVHALGASVPTAFPAEKVRP